MSSASSVPLQSPPWCGHLQTKHSRGWVEADADDVARVFKVRLSYIMGFCLNETEEKEDDRRIERGRGGRGGKRRVGRGREKQEEEEEEEVIQTFSNSRPMELSSYMLNVFSN